MDKELCKQCIQSQYADEHTNSVCEVCYQIESNGNGSNQHFIKRIDIPNCCGECIYCKRPPKNIFIKQKEYCEASETFDKADREIYMQFIRKNYLTKGVPQWCPMKKTEG